MPSDEDRSFTEKASDFLDSIGLEDLTEVLAARPERPADPIVERRSQMDIFRRVRV